MKQPITVTFDFDIPGFKELIQDAVKQVLFDSEVKPKEQEKFISRAETAVRLKISLPTLNKYTKTGKIPAYRLGGKVMYKVHEVEQSLKKIQTR